MILGPETISSAICAIPMSLSTRAGAAAPAALSACGHRRSRVVCYRVRSAQNVLEEMARAKTLFPQAKEFFFDDDTFTDNPHVDEIAQGLGELGITWSCNARADVPKERLRMLKENGLRLLVVGFESGNQRSSTMSGRVSASIRRAFL